MDRLLKRISTLVEIAERRRPTGVRLGKTAMQKLIYLLQELLGARVGYRFELYTYGPYDAALMRDIDYASAASILTLSYDGTLGYDIAVGPAAKELAGTRQQLSKEMGSSIDSLMQEFGELSARELELRSTLVFVAKEEISLSDGELVDRVKTLKPKYDAAEIENAFSELQRSRAFQRLRPPAR